MNNRLLIVDDTLFMRVRLRELVERIGYKVVGEAANGKEAIEKYNYLKPDGILLDITMPVMDGVDCLQALKDINPEAKVIMISAMGQSSFIKQCFKYGAEYFICKPFEEEKVKNVLQAVLPLPEPEPEEESAYDAAMKRLAIKQDDSLKIMLGKKHT